MQKHVIIVGAGISGLACAIELKEKGIPFSIIEKSDRVGGRIKTDDLEGFKLDHGFQVYLPSYEMGQYFLDYKKLGLYPFAAGANIYGTHSKETICDPLREPLKIFSTLLARSSTLKDKLLTMKLIFSSPFDYKKISSQDSALKFLKNYGFSDTYIDNFFKPFFSGVFLNSDLEVSKDYFLYLFSKFSQGKACLPEQGMEALPQLMAEAIDSENLFLNEDVETITDNTLETKSGRHLKFSHLVMACPLAVSQKLGVVSDTGAEKHYPVTTLYFKTQSSKWADRLLYLNSRKERVVNHVACLTAVNPNYAPEGWHLFSVNVLSEVDGNQDSVLQSVKEDLFTLFGEDSHSWEFIKSYKISKALPANPRYGAPVKTSSENIYLCGDFMESPSIQGALTSGFKTAKAISHT